MEFRANVLSCPDQLLRLLGPLCTVASKQIVDDGVNWNTKSNVSSGEKVLQGGVVIKNTVGVLVHLVEEGDLWGGEGGKRGKGEGRRKGREKEDGREGRGERGKRKGRKREGGGGRAGREEGRTTKEEEKEEGVVAACFHIHVNSREVTYLQIILFPSNLKHPITVRLKQLTQTYSPTFNSCGRSWGISFASGSRPNITGCIFVMSGRKGEKVSPS